MPSLFPGMNPYLEQESVWHDFHERFRMPWLDLPECDYCVVSRAERRPKAGAWPIRLRDRLPVIPVPLRQGDPDARLDLQEVLHRVYDAAGYHYYVYTDEATSALSPADAEWARAFLPRG